jgi:AraC-like DNA-binding protein
LILVKWLRRPTRQRASTTGTKTGNAMTSMADVADSQRIGATTAIPALLRQFGVDPVPVLNRAGLRRDALDDGQSRIPYVALCRLYHEAALATGCASFGLLAGQAWRFADLGLAGETARNAPTLGDALRDIASLHRLNSHGAVVFLIEHGNVADFGYAPYARELRGLDQIYDSTIATGVNLLRGLCGERFRPSEVFLARPTPADTGPYRRLFRAPVHFEAEFSALRFPSIWLQQPVLGADPIRYRALKQTIAGVEASALRGDVYRTLRALLIEGAISGDDVAHRLGLERRTLNRHLEAQHTTYQQILDDVRFVVAQQLLGYTHAGMDDVAASLGYDNVASFQRRFRQWSQTTPSEWRRQFQLAHE